VPARGQPQDLLAPILLLSLPLDQPSLDQAIDQPAGRRWRAVDGFGQLTDRQGAAIGEDVQGRQLREAQA
jgi:hypothetical protein